MTTAKTKKTTKKSTKRTLKPTTNKWRPKTTMSNKFNKWLTTTTMKTKSLTTPRVKSSPELNFWDRNHPVLLTYCTAIDKRNHWLMRMTLMMRNFWDQTRLTLLLLSNFWKSRVLRLALWLMKKMKMMRSSNNSSCKRWLNRRWRKERKVIRRAIWTIAKMLKRLNKKVLRSTNSKICTNRMMKMTMEKKLNKTKLIWVFN